ncbi:hypothetical protein [Nocardioides dilutus]
MPIRHSYANVASTLALVVALSGGAYAATKLPKNSVGPKQLKANAVSAAKVKDGGLLGADLKAGEIDKEVAGTPMGGGLTGTFPNPEVDVADLAGVLKGTVLETTFDLATGQDSLLAVPGLGTFRTYCMGSGSNFARFEYINTTASTHRVVTTVSSEGAVHATTGVSASPSSGFDKDTLSSSSSSRGHVIEFAFLGDPDTTVVLTVMTRPTGTDTCLGRMVATTT